MEQFSFEKYLATPSRKVVTSDGRNARIICTDRRDLNFPIIALIETKTGEEAVYSYAKDGRNCNTHPNICDLFFAPEKHEGWACIYRRFMGMDYYIDGIFDSEEKAKERGGSIATVKIEWEE